MGYLTYFDSKVEIDCTDKTLIIPTGDQTKLPKYNEWTLDAAHTGYITETIEQSFDEDKGLFWGLAWLAIADIANYTIDYYVFSEIPYSMDVVADGGAVTGITVNTNTLVFKDSVLWANITADSDADDRPDYLDPYVEGSLGWLLGATGPYELNIALLLDSDSKYLLDSEGKILAVPR